MREKDDLKSAIKYYKFILIRIRFPEDVILQGLSDSCSHILYCIYFIMYVCQRSFEPLIYTSR